MLAQRNLLRSHPDWLKLWSGLAQGANLISVRVLVRAGGISFDSRTGSTILNGSQVQWNGTTLTGRSAVWGSTIIWGNTMVWGSTIIWGNTMVWGSGLPNGRW